MSEPDCTNCHGTGRVEMPDEIIAAGGEPFVVCVLCMEPLARARHYIAQANAVQPLRASTYHDRSMEVSMQQSMDRSANEHRTRYMGLAMEALAEAQERA